VIADLVMRSRPRRPWQARRSPARGHLADALDRRVAPGDRLGVTRKRSKSRPWTRAWATRCSASIAAPSSGQAVGHGARASDQRPI